jgi:hypothetical protein
MSIFGATRRPLSLFLHRFAFHPACETFLIPTVLASISLPFVDNTIPFFSTRVRQVLSHCPLEKALATFTTANK